MESDIKLNGSQIELEATHVVTEAHDLHLNFAGRRKPGGSPYRRALVHGFEDELIVNYSGDYPGGITLNGHIQVLGIDGKRRLHFDSRFGNLYLGGEDGDGDFILRNKENVEVFHINADEKTIVIREVTNWPNWPKESSTSTVDLMKEMRRMKEEILELKSELAQLKK